MSRRKRTRPSFETILGVTKQEAKRRIGLIHRQIDEAITPAQRDELAAIEKKMDAWDEAHSDISPEFEAEADRLITSLDEDWELEHAAKPPPKSTRKK